LDNNIAAAAAAVHIGVEGLWGSYNNRNIAAAAAAADMGRSMLDMSD